MKEENIRTEMVLGKDTTNILKDKTVAVFGIGGVGGHACDALARCGIGNFVLVDNDTVSLSNINRQLIALHSTVGRNKTEVMKERILDINPECNVETVNKFFLPENANEFDFDKYDYIVDCIDTVSGKIELVMKANEFNKKIISSMGTGNKVNPTMFEVSDIYKTSVCPLAKVMRKELKERRIKKLKVVYSKELPIECDKELLDEVMKNDNSNKRSVPGSVSFMPSCAGLIIASEVIKDLLAKK
ncbi:MAG: tRNA threonylcarbamoyladenosine dehydratase [Clostridia bacterium]|nr:tRNA threonylcarbamoyladenosine dehydratase [Clostridia bacterium]